jgi:Methyltransferase domain.
MPDFNPQPLDPRMSTLLAGYPASLFNERLHRSIELLERYSIELAIELLGRLGVIACLDTWRSVPELCWMLSFRDRFDFALAWLLERLIETDCIEAQADDQIRRYRLRSEPWQPELKALRAIGLAIDPANTATLDLLEQAASIYPAVARGETGGDQALFTMERIGSWLAYFHNDNPAYAVNNWLGAIAAAERLADKPTLRILEVGAGAGSASDALLHVFTDRGLAQRIKRYLITEPNAFFRRRGERGLRRRYSHLPLEVGPLDIDRPWDQQGIESGSFDLVYGVNVLHVARDLLFSLGQARVTLSSGGWLVIGECLRPYPRQPIYAELMFQILDSFTDVDIDPKLRPNPGFLTAAQWRYAFARGGFAPVEVTPDIERIRELYRHFFTGAVCGRQATH